LDYPEEETANGQIKGVYLAEWSRARGLKRAIVVEKLNFLLSNA
jgi:hypothetical protein